MEDQLTKAMHQVNDKFNELNLPVRLVSRNHSDIEFVITTAMVKPLLRIKNVTNPTPASLIATIKQHASSIISNIVRHFTSQAQFARNDGMRQLYLNTLNDTINTLVPWLLK